MVYTKFWCYFTSSWFFFTSSDTGYVVGYNGVILKTITGGEIVSIKILNSETPKEYKLYLNYPNPFNPTTTIKFDVPKNSFVSVIIYDILGKQVDKLLNKNMRPGSYEMKWDASNYPSGVYFYSMKAEYFSETKKMMVIK